MSDDNTPEEEPEEESEEEGKAITLEVQDGVLGADSTFTE